MFVITCQLIMLADQISDISTKDECKTSILHVKGFKEMK